MPDDAPHPPDDYTVALRGFTAFERNTLLSSFRLDARRLPRYRHVDSLAEADFVIADADHPATLTAVQAAGRGAHTVFIGAGAPDEALARLTRPIDPRAVLQELDALARPAGGPADDGPPLAPAAAVPPWQVTPAPAPPPPPARRPASTDDGLMNLDAAPAAPARPERRRRPRTPRPGGGPRRIEMLVVDDSAIAARFLQSRLQAMGHRVVVAHDADSALALLARKRFDVVLLDVQLGAPGNLDGIALCQHVKRQGAGPKAPPPAVIIVSGAASAADRVRCELAGCDAFLPKPVMQAELLQALAPFAPPRADA